MRPVRWYAFLKVILPRVIQAHLFAQSTLSNLAPVAYHRCEPLVSVPSRSLFIFTYLKPRQSVLMACCNAIGQRRHNNALKLLVCSRAQQRSYQCSA